MITIDRLNVNLVLLNFFLDLIDMLSWLKPCWQLRLCRSSSPLASSTLEEGPLDPGSRVKGRYQGFYRCQTKAQDDHLKKGKDGRRR